MFYWELMDYTKNEVPKMVKNNFKRICTNVILSSFSSEVSVVPKETEASISLLIEYRRLILHKSVDPLPCATSISTLHKCKQCK